MDPGEPHIFLCVNWPTETPALFGCRAVPRTLAGAEKSINLFSMMFLVVDQPL